MAEPFHSPSEPAGARGRRGRASTRARGRSRKAVALAAQDDVQVTLDGIAAEANGLAFHNDAAAVADSPMQPDEDAGMADAVHEPPKPANRGRRAARKGNRS